jgi:hypothetical protein
MTGFSGTLAVETALDSSFVVANFTSVSEAAGIVEAAF